ncbi:MAG: lysylphosphatidylglycerol synthase transmembrane domain-containing protein [Myxococcales bacterium]|nr:lysylphosphatidylglycerol synthase transmembrane domain-containing protein [Myxococcales bacterium]
MAGHEEVSEPGHRQKDEGPGERSTRGARARRVLWVVQITATIGAFTYLFYTVDWSQVQAAYARASLTGLLAACGIFYGAIAVGTARWRLLLIALGAVEAVSLLHLFRWYLIGLFYNTYVPGGVGGDVVRALAIRDAFGPRGAAASLATVLIERAMGLGGMLVVVAGTTLMFPLAGMEHLGSFGALGLLLALAGFFGLAFANRLAQVVPAPLADLLQRLPVVRRYWPVAPAVVTAVVTHLLAALVGHTLIVTVAPHVALTESLTLVPLALASVYIPISVGGVGVVEVALVKLLALVAVPEGDALVIALMLRLCQWVVAAPGGLLVLAKPRATAGSSAEPNAS